MGRKPEDIIGHITETDMRAVDNLKSRLDLFRKENSTMKLSIFPILASIANYSASSSTPSSSVSSTGAFSCTSTASVTNVVHERVSYKERLTRSPAERMDVFQHTHLQSDCSIWFEERRGRITGSICGRIINRNCSIYPKSIIDAILKTPRVASAAMLMGREQENKILSRYLHYRRENSYPELVVEKAGFLIDKEFGWLGASPDAVAILNSSRGCVEIKAAVSFWDKSISEAVGSKKATFCLTGDEKHKIHLKKKHPYFHQCQLQLYVGRDIFEFCDFVLATQKDLFVERITLHKDWAETNVQELECFYDSFILPRFCK